MVLGKGHVDRWRRLESPEIHMLRGQFLFNKDARNTQEEKTVSSTNSVGTSI